MCPAVFNDTSCLPPMASYENWIITYFLESRFRVLLSIKMISIGLHYSSTSTHKWIAGIISNFRRLTFTVCPMWLQNFFLSGTLMSCFKHRRQHTLTQQYCFTSFFNTPCCVDIAKQHIKCFTGGRVNSPLMKINLEIKQLHARTGKEDVPVKRSSEVV